MSSRIDERLIIDELSKMLRPFADCEMYSIIDRLANATSKEAVEAALYEALRASRAARDDKLCEKPREKAHGGIPVKPYVPREEAVKGLLDKLDSNLIEGLELVRKIVIRALALPGGEK